MQADKLLKAGRTLAAAQIAFNAVSCEVFLENEASNAQVICQYQQHHDASIATQAAALQDQIMVQSALHVTQLQQRKEEGDRDLAILRSLQEDELQQIVAVCLATTAEEKRLAIYIREAELEELQLQGVAAQQLAMDSTNTLGAAALASALQEHQLKVVAAQKKVTDDMQLKANDAVQSVCDAALLSIAAAQEEELERKKQSTAEKVASQQEAHNKATLTACDADSELVSAALLKLQKAWANRVQGVADRVRAQQEVYDTETQQHTARLKTTSDAASTANQHLKDLQKLAIDRAEAELRATEADVKALDAMIQAKQVQSDAARKEARLELEALEEDHKRLIKEIQDVNAIHMKTSKEVCSALIVTISKQHADMHNDTMVKHNEQLVGDNLKALQEHISHRAALKDAAVNTGIQLGAHYTLQGKLWTQMFIDGMTSLQAQLPPDHPRLNPLEIVWNLPASWMSVPQVRS